MITVLQPTNINNCILLSTLKKTQIKYRSEAPSKAHLDKKPLGRSMVSRFMGPKASELVPHSSWSYVERYTWWPRSWWWGPALAGCGDWGLVSDLKKCTRKGKRAWSGSGPGSLLWTRKKTKVLLKFKLDKKIWWCDTLFRKKRLMLDEKFQRNASKFAIFYVYENPT